METIHIKITKYCSKYDRSLIKIQRLHFTHTIPARALNRARSTRCSRPGGGDASSTCAALRFPPQSTRGFGIGRTFC